MQGVSNPRGLGYTDHCCWPYCQPGFISIWLWAQERGAQCLAQGPGVGSGWVPEQYLDEHPKPLAIAFNC